MSSAIDQLKTQLRQLSELAQSGALDEAPYQAAKAKLERQLLDTVMAADDATAAPADAAPLPKVSAKLKWGMAAFVAVVGAVGYQLVGTPSAWQVGPAPGGPVADNGGAEGDTTAPSGTAPHTMSEDQIRAMVDGLAAKLKAEPNNSEGWAMLARTYAVLKRFDEALPAYRKAIELRPNDAQLYADFADALAVTQGRKLEGEPARLIQKALSLDGNNFKALSLAGTIAYDQQDFAKAAALWDRAVHRAPASNPELVRQMRSALDDARQRAGIPLSDAAMPGAADTGTSPAASDAGGRVSGTVTLSKQLVGKVSPDDTVFIFAKAAQGPKMPLAILRKQVRDLPIQFELTDAMAMAPQFKLSGFSDVVVGARISHSGNAMPQPGDWAGQSAPVKVGTQGLQIAIGDAVR